MVPGQGHKPEETSQPSAEGTKPGGFPPPPPPTAQPVELPPFGCSECNFQGSEEEAKRHAETAHPVYHDKSGPRMAQAVDLRPSPEKAKA